MPASDAIRDMNATPGGAGGAAASRAVDAPDPSTEVRLWFGPQHPGVTGNMAVETWIRATRYSAASRTSAICTAGSRS